MVSTSRPSLDVSTPKISLALGFTLITTPVLSISINPSLMESVMAVNSLRRFSSSSWSAICRCCRSTRVSRGLSSS